MVDHKPKKSNKSKTSLVKIEADLYFEIKDFVSKNQIEYPSVKNFIEKASSHLLKSHIPQKDKAHKHDTEPQRLVHYVN